MGYSMTMGATGLMAGALPTPAKAPVQVVATTGSEYVIPMAAVTGASEAFKQLRKLKPKKRKGRYR
jgi:hypothetical protein